MGEIRIIKPGALSTLQDKGRFGFRKIGFPNSGFLDSYAAFQANYLLGNAIGNPVIEMILTGVTIESIGALVIATSGADMGFTINGNEAPQYEAVPVKAGDIIAFSGAKSGNIAYLAIQGQWRLDPVMNSNSTLVKAKMGGLHGSPLKAGDVLTVEPKEKKINTIPEHLIRTYPKGSSLRLLKGAESTPEIVSWLRSTPFKINQQFDRMGMKLDAHTAYDSAVDPILSSPVVPGILQMPSSDRLIALLADGQTTGGYPRIGKIIDYDISYLVQQPPGSDVRFTYVDLADAQQINTIGYQLFRQ